MPKIQIEVKRKLPRFDAGTVVTVDADADGRPIDYYWYKRLQDAQRDGCCRVITTEKKRKAPTPKKEELDNG
jgi:hypothetical protein